MLRRRTLLAGGLALGAGVAIGNGGAGEFADRVRAAVSPTHIETIEFAFGGQLSVTLAADHDSDAWAIWHEADNGLDGAFVGAPSPDGAGPIELSFLRELHDSGRVYPSPTFVFGLFETERPTIEREEDVFVAMFEDTEYHDIAEAMFTVPDAYHDEPVFEDGMGE